MERPFGVTLLAILWILQALVAFAGAAAMGALTAFVEEILGEAAVEAGFIATIFSAVAIVAVIFGVIYLLIAYGLWTGQGWA